MLALITCAVIGALAERLRGGYPPMGTPGSDNGAGRARAVRSLALGMLAYGCGAPLYIAVATAATLWLGILNSHARCWRVQDTGQLLDMLHLGVVRGVFGLLPLLVWGAVSGAETAVVILIPALTVAHAAAYALAAHLDARLPRAGGMLDDWNAYAELAWGAVLGASIALLTGVVQ